MTARTIPTPGEAFLGDDPSVMKVLKITFGDTNQDVTINDSDTVAATIRPICSLPYGIHVYDIGWRVITAFNGGVDLTLSQDCDNDCQFFAKDTDIACTTARAGLMTTRQQSMQLAADSRADEGSVTLLGGFEGFTPDSNGNNLGVSVWQGDSIADSGVLEVYVYYHGAVSS